MSKDGGPDWNGLLKWSLAHGDGTNPPRALSEEDRKWFMEAMQENTLDVVKRMKEITQVMKTPEDVLQSQGITPENIEEMLDELQEHVESIDMANDLHSIGGLDPLLGYLKNSHAGIRAKAAEVVSTIVQNNPKSQQLVMESNGLEPLLTNFTSDPNTNARTKALGAISSLIRHNQPGISAFRLGNGYAGLKEALGSDDARLQRKALNLIQYLLHNKTDRSVATELGLPKLMMHLASSDDSLVREAALGGLLELAQDKTSGAGNALPDQDKLKEILKSRIEGISTMDADDLHAAREERQLVDSLWKECYNEPSSLREKGLVVLPGEDAPQPPPPDVAGKMFEPPLRAWAAARPASRRRHQPAPSRRSRRRGGSRRRPPPPAMGRVRTKTVKKTSRQVIEKYYSRMTLDFHTNKKVLEEVSILPSKRLRNKVAGFTTHLMRRIQRGPVRGISLKLQEEERERRMDFVPEKSALEVEEIRVDKETMEMLAALGMADLPGVERAPEVSSAPTYGRPPFGGPRRDRN